MPERVDRARLHAFMRALAEAVRQPLQVYLAGGATAVLEGWRESTIDVDLKLGHDADAVLRAIPAIKERLRLNIELASPADFIPVKAGWEDRSPYGSEGCCGVDWPWPRRARTPAGVFRRHRTRAVPVSRHRSRVVPASRRSGGSRQIARLSDPFARWPDPLVRWFDASDRPLDR